MTKKYKIYMVREQRGEVFDGYVEIIECSRPPRLGEGFQQLIDPPISNYIVKVEEYDEK